MSEAFLIIPAVIVIVGVAVVAFYIKLARWMFRYQQKHWTESYYKKYYLVVGIGLSIFGLILLFSFVSAMR